ncbi:TPA: hypothetical protein U1Y72_000651 [Streptococcus suis]|nr:hypothetical protein [Streptococcus suis]NQI92740.1 hypothetical protein [Streptococcus suis]NQJ00589.1 hypothetical protein [Streptococcus suis]HEM4248699.1 hypothetical protein [Streptococcus suis]HEM4402355.1 hypothetical protein [Streptococcus suis]
MSQMKKIASLLAELEQNNRTILEITQRNQTIRFEIQELLSPKETKVEEKQPTPTFTKEDVRKVLAKKAKDGFKNEVRALLYAYGAESLSTLAEKHYGVVMEEAGGIGND